MRLAVLSDIHGNLTALEAVLADIDRVGAVDMTWCLGDLAAFGARPAECIRRIKALAEADEGKTFKAIGGNTDRYLVTGERMKMPTAKDEEHFSKLADGWQSRDTSLNWAVKQLRFEDYEYLKKLRGAEVSLEAKGYGYIIGYHAVPGDDEAMIMPDTPADETLDFLLDREGNMGIGGHIHKQMDRDLERWRVVNVGSVGMSFDRPGYAQWGLFTFEENGAVTVDLRNVPYDVEAAVADLQAVGYPDIESAARRLRG